jgi:hypothetical protein
MKKQPLVLLVSMLAFVYSLHAQPGGAMSGPHLYGGVAKLFGDNPVFSADVEFQTTGPNQQPMTMPGKIAFDTGKSRFEMNVIDSNGGQMSPAYAEHIKAMGMDRTVIITRPDLKITYIAYPGLSAYAETAPTDPDVSKPASAFKVKTTELGHETVEGHPCVKNKVVVTDDKGQEQEFTVWNASDLKKFPVKIETTEQGRAITMIFKNIKASKIDAAQFSPPTDYKKYDSQRTLIQQEMMKRMGVKAMPTRHP